MRSSTSLLEWQPKPVLQPLKILSANVFVTQVVTKKKTNIKDAKKTLLWPGLIPKCFEKSNLFCTFDCWGPLTAYAVDMKDLQAGRRWQQRGDLGFGSQYWDWMASFSGETAKKKFLFFYNIPDGFSLCSNAHSHIRNISHLKLCSLCECSKRSRRTKRKCATCNKRLFLRVPKGRRDLC